jgi:outer membrane protein assembly factor BamB
MTKKSFVVRAVAAGIRNAAVAGLTLGMCLFANSQNSFAGDPLDWAHWRGPEHTGVSREKGLPDKWTPAGENLIWSKPDYGSRCTPIVMNGKMYIVCRAFPETTKEGEKTVCLDANTGDVKWESIHNIFLADAPAERVGWSSPVGDPETGNIYVLGLGALFQCLDGETGAVLWEHSMMEEYGMIAPYGGRTNFPVVFEDLVIISGVMTNYGDNAVPAHRFVAFDKRTGAAVWFMSTRVRPEDTTYSTPVFTTFNGQAAMVCGAADGAVYAIQPRTGKVIWKYDASPRGVNTTPLVIDNIVYCAHGEKNKADPTILGAVFAFDGRATGDITEDKLLWKVSKKTVSRSAPVMINDRIHIMEDDSTLLVIDSKTGAVVSEKKLGRVMYGSSLFADNKLYVGENNGTFWVLKSTEKGVEEVSKTRLKNEEIFATPVVSHGKIYLVSAKTIYCIGNKDAAPSADPIPPAVPETPVSANQEVAHIQLAPVEAMLKPGQATPFQVRAYNKNGQFLKTVTAEFTVEGGGAVDSTGIYTAPAEQNPVVVKITAKLGELSSTARARIIPPLPWAFDFNDKQVPSTWIGAAYRHKPIDVDGESALVKVSTIPKGTRSQSWMGFTRMKDYTVQADFKATGTQESRPDMGLVNQRYTLDLMAKGQLQLRSWTPRLELRFAKSIDFPWEAGQWYTMKFQGEQQPDKIVLRGKVWKRGEAEPEAWTVEAADATPNQMGSPGMFGNSTASEFLIDNVKVFSNK